MTEVPSQVSALQRTLNRLALVISLVILAGIGGLWLRDRTRRWEVPAWRPSRFVAMSPSEGAGRPEWIVVVNPDCLHCRARLAELLRRERDPLRDPALGVLLVDTRDRPEPLDDASRLDGGVWWDSTGVWRSQWGHRVYGEVLVFDGAGALQRIVGPESDPQAAATTAAR